MLSSYFIFGLGFWVGLYLNKKLELDISSLIASILFWPIIIYLVWTRPKEGQVTLDSKKEDKDY